jgi:hypothetical protein
MPHTWGERLSRAAIGVTSQLELGVHVSDVTAVSARAARVSSSITS